MTREDAERLLTTITQSRIPNIKAEIFETQEGCRIRVHHILVDPRFPWLWWIQTPAEWAKLRMGDLKTSR